MFDRKILIAALGSIALVAGSAQADLVVTNGDFEASGHTAALDGPQDVAGWYDNAVAYTAWEFGENIDAADDTVVAMSSAGWMYQSLGTYNIANGSTLNWSFDLSPVTTHDDAFEIEFFAGAFAAAAEDVDILGHASQPSSIGTDSKIGDGVHGGSVDLSGVADGTEVWVRINGGGFERVDDVSVTVIPEPGSLALVGLGGLMMLRRRRA